MPSLPRLRAKLILPLAVALVVPMVSYTVFVFAERNRDEELILSVYERQLNGIVFSVNQYCWDTFRSWAARLGAAAEMVCDDGGGEQVRERAGRFVRETAAVPGVIVRCGSTAGALCVGAPSTGSARMLGAVDVIRADRLLAEHRERIDKIVSRAEQGYVQPFVVPWDTADGAAVSALFVPLTVSTGVPPGIAVMLVDDSLFVAEVVARKFREMDDGNFSFAVRAVSGESLHTTDREHTGEYELSESLWLLPHLRLLAGLRGTTLADLSAGRVRRNLALLLFVNVVLVVGIVYLVRSVRAEMALARQKTDFVANVSHELRTPLSLIQMHVETLDMGRVSSDEKRHHYYRVVLNETARLSRLVDTILDFFRIESGRREYRLAPADPRDVVEDALRAYDMFLEERGFELNRGLEGSFPPIRVDGEAIPQALINLIDNAVKFSGDSHRIDIGLEVRGRWVVVWVRDYGIGIPEHEQQRIFEKFYRVSGPGGGEAKGSGLGLSLVSHVMRAHGGKVTVESEPGKGSTFSLYFPSAPQMRE
ncbi:MAG: hypothetical protein GF331_04600 [Chitinivibrionales bacterium]|nr:hypothetical protein [Chitinivibrionales bacterium]